MYFWTSLEITRRKTTQCELQNTKRNLRLQDMCPPLLMPLLLFIALGNIFLLLGSSSRFFLLRQPQEYTWINKDFPVIMPVGAIPTVEMTFQESIRFGPYHFRYVTSAYHSLHCLYTMRQDFDKPNHTDSPSFHFTHCMTYLRQIFLCNADMTLEDGDFMSKNFTTDRVGQTRRCRDWWKVSDWINENNKEWADYNSVSLD
ncbi:hypothetical protein B0H10DRAFT_287088 [Mycena sp. CBHHK59/15]|nr:hypothetical protein B0H10DRAFT_287088 [Mycena sp. CBHHK59/15]